MTAASVTCFCPSVVELRGSTRTESLRLWLTSIRTISDELRRELRRPAAFRGAAAQDQGGPAVLDDRLRLRVAVGAPHLGDALEAEHAPAAELAEARERVLQPVDRAQGVELVDDEP